LLVTGKAIPVPACKSLVRPLVLQEDEASRISRQLAHVGGNIVSTLGRLPLSTRRDAWCSFLLEGGRIRSMKNGTHDLWDCSAVTQPAAPCSAGAASTSDNTATSVCCSRKVFLHVSLYIITDNYKTRSCFFGLRS
jgi:hypothetical protein